ncbi:unnamed protein product [Oikopleura dioica]|uniref:Uncharacterized protein n=1 Tax=Oikopleura dioica TaxID=34765 RepID=E4Y5F2_OIKDI|nr:unnamed protein product [Oikopleura dioica]
MITESIIWILVGISLVLLLCNPCKEKKERTSLKEDEEMDNSRQAGAGAEGLSDDLEMQGTTHYSEVEEDMDTTASTGNEAETSFVAESSGQNSPPPSYEEAMETMTKGKCRRIDTEEKQEESENENK